MDFSKMDKNKCPKMDFGFSNGGKKERFFIRSLSRFLNNIYLGFLKRFSILRRSKHI
jgi:hypothetical protein